MVCCGVVAVAVIGWWFLLRSDAPPAPGLASAVEAATAAQTGSTVATSTTVTHPTTSSAYETTATTQAPVATTAPTTTPAVAAAGTDGTCAVVTATGAFIDVPPTRAGARDLAGRGPGCGQGGKVLNN